jgi:hypothetical protein
LAYAATALLAAGGLAALFTKADAKYRRIGRWLVFSAVLALPPIVTTGMLAHCRQVWHAAEVEAAPPNLPWYRLTRHAARSGMPFHTAAIQRHAWLGAAVTVALALAVAGYIRKRPRWRDQTLVAGAAFLTVAILATVATGTSIRTPDDPVTLTSAVHVHLILTGLALSAAGLVLVLYLRPEVDPPTLRRAAVLAIAILFISIGLSLFITTAWQPRRLPALFRQPRDAAYLLVSIAAIVVLDAILWAAARHPNRWKLTLAAPLAVLLAAQLWLATLILYDGSHRGSQTWRFHRPFVQAPDR